MRRNVGWALLAVLVVGALLAPSAGAKVRYPRLDDSFGSGGYVSLPGQIPGPGTQPMRLESLSAAPGGAVYATETSMGGGSCGLGRCGYQVFLARVNSDGSIASTFGGSGKVEVAGDVDAVGRAVSDLEGRALIATSTGSSVTVHRYLADGSADPSFGSGGATTFDCGCGTVANRTLRLAVDGQGRTVLSISNPGGAGYSVVAAAARLLPSGAVDSSFGQGGVVQLGAQPIAFGIAFGTNDAIYMWGNSYGASGTPYLHRVSAKGRVDTTFNAKADQTLRNVSSRNALDLWKTVLVVRPHGLLDLYGGDALLRLRSNGTAEAKFGEGGVKPLGWSILAATLVGNGKILGLGSSSEGLSLIRLLSNGKPDRSFGQEGARVIEGPEGESFSLARLNGRRAQVLSLGLSTCRNACEPSPTLVRYRIGPKQG